MNKYLTFYCIQSVQSTILVVLAYIFRINHNLTKKAHNQTVKDAKNTQRTANHIPNNPYPKAPPFLFICLFPLGSILQ